MKQLRLLLSMVFVSFVLVSFLAPAQASAVSCPVKGDILGIPTWYKYLDGQSDANGNCVPKINGCTVAEAGKVSGDTTCVEQSGIDASKIWLIALAVIEILLRLGGIIAVGMVIFGGFKYITSQGNSDATKSARGTIINAFIGIVITIVASISVNFIAKLLQK